MSAKTFFLLLALSVVVLGVKELFTRRRLFSCMNGHLPRVERVPNTEKVLLVCPREGCGNATHQHNRIEDALVEWNNAGSRLWREYDVRWWHQFMRWWHGTWFE